MPVRKTARTSTPTSSVARKRPAGSATPQHAHETKRPNARASAASVSPTQAMLNEIRTRGDELTAGISDLLHRLG